MFDQLLSTVQTKVFVSSNIRLALVVLTLIVFLLGAGAPSDGGGLGGF